MATVCSICGETSLSNDICDPCAGLLRWFQEYLDFDESLRGYITPETHFIRDILCDSLEWIEWRMEAEEKFGLRLTDQQAEKISTVGEFIRILRDHGVDWPADRKIQLRERRGRWWTPWIYDVVERQDPSGSNGFGPV